MNVVVGNPKCRVFGNHECRDFGNNEYTKMATRVQSSKVDLVVLFFKNSFAIFKPVALSSEVNHFALV